MDNVSIFHSKIRQQKIIQISHLFCPTVLFTSRASSINNPSQPTKHKMDASPRPSGAEMNLPTDSVGITTPHFLDRLVASPANSSSVRPMSLRHVPDANAQQALIARDLVNNMLGYEGSYVRHSEHYRPELIHDRILGPDFRLSRHLDPSLRALTKQVASVGKFYSGLRNFSEIYDQPYFGRVNQRLCHEITRFLAQYRSLVLAVQKELTKNSSLSITAIDNEVRRNCGEVLKQLYEITREIHLDTEARNLLFREATSVAQCTDTLVSSEEPRFGDFLEATRRDVQSKDYAFISSDSSKLTVCKGGPVLDIIYGRIHQYKGDAIATAFLSEVYEKVSSPYVMSLNTWLLTGVINDPFQEFLVKKNNLPNLLLYANVERFWKEQYVIKLDAVANQLVSNELQAKILLTGKYLNIFKKCIGNPDLDSLPDDLSVVSAPTQITSLFSSDLTVTILQAYGRANNILLRVFFRGYYLKEIIRNLHKTYAMSNSFLIDSFLDRTFNELARSRKRSTKTFLVNLYNEQFQYGKPTWQAKNIFDNPQHQIVNIEKVLQLCESFDINDTNFYDVAESVTNPALFDADVSFDVNENALTAVKRYVSQTLHRPATAETSRADSASIVDGASENIVTGAVVDINLPFPLNLIITEDFVVKYRLVYRFQMILKFASKLVELAWKTMTTSELWNHPSFLQQVKKSILTYRALISRMRIFMNEIQAYVNFTVIQPNYDLLDKASVEFESSVDKQRPAHLTNRHQHVQEQHFLKKQGFKTNSIFDEKIQTNRQVSQHTPASEEFNEVNELSRYIQAYLNNILEETMILNSTLRLLLQHMIQTISDFSIVIGRLNKTLILLDADLLDSYTRNYPDKFGAIEYSPSLAAVRLNGLNQLLRQSQGEFNAGLAQMTGELHAAGKTKPAFIVLHEQLTTI